jgi:alkaline phosphatase
MGHAQVAAAEAWLATQEGKIGSEPLSFTKFPVMGMATTYSANSFVTCSSASGTALSTGFKTNNGMLGVDPDLNKLESISYKIHEQGIPVGIMSDVTIDHATPASFYANNESRSNYYDIASQLPRTGFEFFGGGEFAEPEGKEKDRENIYSVIEESGYKILRGIDEFQKRDKSDKILFFQEEEGNSILPYAIDREPGDLMLCQVVAAAIDHLYGTDGFFIMAEGGKIDWAGHSNDGKSNILEVLDLSAAVQVAYNFYERYPNETLIIVTADHETGGMTLGGPNGYVVDLKQLDPQKSSMASEKDSTQFFQELNKKANLGWTTTGHTGVAVPVFAVGPGSRLFSGKMDNTEIPRKILQAMGIEF